ncbi:FG-GAP-like repeat-containing protein [Pseudotenacibaculum sp. MALMAid0570]|uniref:FG-GAP-like repeat-containing protein n=1 Tax=Pseudotenacibaculum sp. MALMAid0570 TaxID=3143938 RepID=UPI0032DF568C
MLVSTSVLAQFNFFDKATSAGANYSYGNSVFGGGVSFSDFNNDGWDDLTYSTDATEKIIFLENNGNSTFSKVELLGIDNKDLAKSVMWVDFDNDGDKDFFTTSLNGINRFYENTGNMIFTDITNTCGIFTNDLLTYGASFGDIDNDGDLDLFISNRGQDAANRNYLYRNDNGTFVDISSAAGIVSSGELSFCSSFFDYNNDGFQDIYVANDKADMNRLYKNDGDGTFTDVSVSSGAGITIDAMSTTIGDYNNDGHFDIYITNTDAGNYLLKNNGDGTFTNTAPSTGTEFLSIAWGAVFLDADNDSNLDLYVSGMLDGSDPNRLPSAFYHNNGAEIFSIPNNIGLSNDVGQSYGNAIGDYDNNGRPEIVVMNDTDNYYLWSDNSVNTNNWLKIKLEGVSSNKDGVGNRIEISAGGKIQYRYTVSGEGYLGQNSSYEFVGVGTATNIDYVKVTWNKTGQVETINNITPNQAILIQEGNGIVLSVESQELNTFSIYPNPSAEGLYKFNTGEENTCFIEVFDLSGRVVVAKKEINNSQEIDLINVAKGVYLAKVSTSDNKSKTIKLVRN